MPASSGAPVEFVDAGPDIPLHTRRGAERDGAVKVIHAKPGDSLAVDAVILEFK